LDFEREREREREREDGRIGCVFLVGIVEEFGSVFFPFMKVFKN
jgi:hypothetical protein